MLTLGKNTLTTECIDCLPAWNLLLRGIFASAFASGILAAASEVITLHANFTALTLLAAAIVRYSSLKVKVHICIHLI